MDLTNDSKIADWLLIVVLLLMAIGTVFVFSAGVNLQHTFELNRFYDYAPLRQIIYFPLAVLVLIAFSRFNYRRLSLHNGRLKSPVIYFLILSIVLLILVSSQRFYPTLPQIVPKINMHYRWLKIPLGPVDLSFQPSELGKWSLIIFLAAVCDRYQDQLGRYFKTFIPMCIAIGLVAGLVIIEDFGTAAFICLISFLVMLFAGCRLWHMLTPLPFAVVGFAYVVISSPHRIERIRAFLNPQELAGSAAYQANQSLIALGSGGLFGKGLGGGICKYGHLPEDTTDFIFAIIGEELGFIGTVSVILLFIVFVWLSLIIVVRCRDRFGQLLAAGICFAVAVQAAINIGVVTVVLPTKGIPLPFISAGGTSLLLTSAAVGVLINIAKQTKPADSLEELET